MKMSDRVTLRTLLTILNYVFDGPLIAMEMAEEG